jgi:hypothetical protein
MAVLSVQDEYQSGDNVTALNLNNLVNQANFTTDTTDNSTLEVHSAGYLKVKDDGIQAQHLKSDPSDTNDGQRAVTTNHIRNENVTTAKLADEAVTTAKIADDNVTFAKIQEMPARTVIGNNTDATANPTAVPIDDLKDSIDNATTTEDGLMSSTDKTKLDGVAENATANTGTVTSVSGGTGISGTVTTSGSLSLSNSGVSAGTYTNATVTVDAKGRVTSASSGSSGTSIKASGIIEDISGQGIVVTSAVNCSLQYNGGNNHLLTLGSGTINKIFFHDYSSNNYHVRFANTLNNNLGGSSINLSLSSVGSSKIQFMVI